MSQVNKICAKHSSASEPIEIDLLL